LLVPLPVHGCRASPYRAWTFRINAEQDCFLKIAVPLCNWAIGANQSIAAVWQIRDDAIGLSVPDGQVRPKE
jgi:hypothetical protein